jgi:IS1 family transposase
MYTLSAEKKLTVISALLEGNSIRSIERMTGVHRDTICRLLVSVGENCAAMLDARLRNLPCRYVQCDEIWCFVGKKQRRVRKDDGVEIGDQWIFVAEDADTKLIASYTVGKRSIANTMSFIGDLHNRLAQQIQLTTDGFHFYTKAVPDIFGLDVDFAQLIKLFGDYGQHENARYSPPRITEVISKVRVGNPSVSDISTSYVERQNLTMRMQIRRLTRLTNAFSKKLANLKAAVALHFAFYNFCRVHSSLRITPAMAAGITEHVWELRELMAA